MRSEVRLCCRGPWRRWLAALLLCAAPAAPGFEYAHHGHYGFATLTPAEAGGAAVFEACLAPPGGAFDPGGRVRRVVARPAPDGGATLYLGGWPAVPAGSCDLVLRAVGPGGLRRDLVRPQAVPVVAPRMDVAILLDDSHSMRETDPQRLRVEAVRLFARIAAGRGEVRTLSLVAFSRRARLLLPPTPPAETAAIEQALARLDAGGSTDLDAAFTLACTTLDRLPASRKYVVVLSDGRDEPGRYGEGHRFCAGRRWPMVWTGQRRPAQKRWPSP